MGTQPGFSTRATSVPKSELCLLYSTSSLHVCVSVCVCTHTLRQSHYVALTAWNSVDPAGLKFIAFIPTSLLDFIFFFFFSFFKLG